MEEEDGGYESGEGKYFWNFTSDSESESSGSSNSMNNPLTFELFGKLQRIEKTFVIPEAAEKIEVFCDFYEKNFIAMYNGLRSTVIVEDLLLMCFKRRIMDNQLVIRILKWLDAIEDGFEKLFCYIIKYGFIGPIAELEEEAKPDNCVLSYLLHHATTGRLLIEERPYFSFDFFSGSFNMFLKLFEGNPKAVHSLFMYCSWFSKYSTNYSKKSSECLIVVLMVFINIGIRLRQWTALDLKLKVPEEELNYDVRNYREIIHFFLRLVPNPHYSSYLLASRGLITGKLRLDGEVIEGPIPKESVVVPFLDILFPGLYLGRKIPSRLKHICRCEIRDRLLRNWALPDGIQKLGLPHILCDYLNLWYD